MYLFLKRRKKLLFTPPCCLQGVRETNIGLVKNKAVFQKSGPSFVDCKPALMVVCHVLLAPHCSRTDCEMDFCCCIFGSAALYQAAVR